jgi:uncharacterized protein (TIGR02284 family)
MSYTKNVSDKLNILLKKNIEAEQGFIDAAEKMENPAIKSFFNNKSKERGLFAFQIKSQIIQMNEEFKDEDGLKAKAHRTWMEVKSLLTTDKEEAVLEEVIRGEKYLVSEYEEVLKDVTMPLSIRNMLTVQLNKIKSGLEIVEKMEAVR